MIRGIHSIFLTALMLWQQNTFADSTQPGDYANLTHIQALTLVVETQVEIIEELERELWWPEHSTEERKWIVNRPFHPGIIDSRHMFIVTYEVGGIPLKSWDVDIKMKLVSERN